MDNEHLRTAITGSGLTLDEFAAIVQVDVKTVQRWLAGRTPYPRLRSRAAGALDTTEHALWPDAVPPPATPDALAPTAHPPGDTITGHARAADDGAPSVADLLGAAVDRVEISIPDLECQPDLAELLRERGDGGCVMRIMIENPDEHVEALLGIDAIEVRAPSAGGDPILYRADDQILLVLAHVGFPGDSPPVIHLRRLVDGGLFDRLADHFDDRWLQAAPLTGRQQLRAYVADADVQSSSDPAQTAAPDPAGPPTPAETQGPFSADAPRRWPRRPT